MGGRPMSGGSEERIADLERRVAELRQVNEELGRELVAGAGSRRPRSPIAAARALAKLTNERDAARAELEAANAELARLRPANEHLQREVSRLRSGTLGRVRRAWARLTRR